MYLIRNIEALKNENIQVHDTEYEIVVDSYIVGEFTYGPYTCGLWEFGQVIKGEERKLYLHVCEKAYPAVHQPENPEEYSGFYHGGSIAEEFVYLASLFLRRRLKLGPVIRWNNKPYLFPKRKRWLDNQLLVGKSNLNDLNNWFQLTEGLDTKYHQRFILAARLYHHAISIIDEQPDMAYLDLISAIETLSRDYDIGIVTIADMNNKKLESYLNEIDNTELRRNIEKTIVENSPLIARRFKKFIIDNIEEVFWTAQGRPVLGRINREDLPSFLGRIYAQRSKTLHNAEPFPGYIFNKPINGEEIPFAKSISQGEKRWNSKEYIPYPHFFERLVNHVLKIFLKKNSNE